MQNYYSAKLSAQKLKKCYDIASPRIIRYLESEVEFVAEHIKPNGSVLELGCGYGRVIESLASKASSIAGIDTSLPSLQMAADLIDSQINRAFFQMDAASLGFSDDAFDLVVCIQNGLSAFKVDRRKLIEEALRVTRPGGMALFSSYAEKFWPERLRWFELQAEHGLL
ncbi:MAG: class I SAM-dependent methyltransferase, partial [FCB group bacterium]|nr:class I SAM-dependent methyltransferase [FCB group bacterium]